MEMLSIQLLGYACFIIGNILALSSFFALRITGTFLGKAFSRIFSTLSRLLFGTHPEENTHRLVQRIFYI